MVIVPGFSGLKVFKCWSFFDAYKIISCCWELLIIKIILFGTSTDIFFPEVMCTSKDLYNSVIRPFSNAPLLCCLHGVSAVHIGDVYLYVYIKELLFLSKLNKLVVYVS